MLVLYFKPDTFIGNGVGVFNFWNKSKEDEEAHLFARYMTNWVAGVKLIFIALLLVIVVYGSDLLKILSLAVTTISISTFYIRLYPIMKRLDVMGKITPKGYSKALLFMITVIMAVMIGAVTFYTT